MGLKDAFQNTQQYLTATSPHGHFSTMVKSHMSAPASWFDLSLGYAVVEVVIIQFSLLFSSCFAYYYCLTPVFRYLRMHRRQVFHCIPRKICVFCSFGRKSSEELKEKKNNKKISYIKQCKSKSRKDFSS